MKRFTGILLALVLCTALLCVPASAAENGQKEERDPSAPVRTYGTLAKEEDGRYLLSRNGQAEYVLTPTENILCLDAVTGLPTKLEELREDEMVYAYIGPIMLLSYPAQTNVHLLLVNIPADFAVPSYYTITAVAKDGRGLKLSTDQGESVTVPADATLFPYLTKNIVTLDSLQVGTRILVWSGLNQTVTKVMVFGQTPAATFTDVAADSVYFAPVRYVSDKGILNGTTDTTFNPNGTMSRAMAATVLWRMAGSPALEYPEGKLYRDVKTGSYYETAAYWARQNTLLNTPSDEIFAPNASITREEFANAIYRYEQKQGGGFTGNWMFLLDFTDREDISESAYEGVAWCVKEEILTGSKGKLSPQGTLTRAQAAAILMRYMEK